MEEHFFGNQNMNLSVRISFFLLRLAGITTLFEVYDVQAFPFINIALLTLITRMTEECMFVAQ